jgi:hypothetical protein
MGEWGQATFFRTDDLDALERAIHELCIAEGLVAAPYVRRKRERWDRMQYGTGATSDRWALALGTGQGGWSEERSPHQRRRVVNVLARGLVGARANTDAAYRGFKRVITEPTPKALGTGLPPVVARGHAGPAHGRRPLFDV